MSADERSADRDRQGGITRRRFLVGSGVASAAALALGGAAAYDTPLHDWLARLAGDGASVGSAPTHEGVTLVSSTPAVAHRLRAGPFWHRLAARQQTGHAAAGRARTAWTRRWAADGLRRLRGDSRRDRQGQQSDALAGLPRPDRGVRRCGLARPSRLSSHDRVHPPDADLGSGVRSPDRQP